MATDTKQKGVSPLLVASDPKIEGYGNPIGAIEYM